MPTRFDLAYALALPALAPYLALRRARGKYSESAGGMLGRRLPAQPIALQTLWLHAVSVGEIAAATAVAPGLQKLLPDLPLVVSTITETGQAAAARAFPSATRTYFPLDLSPIVRRFHRAFAPGVFVLLETELWPNFLALAHERGTRCFMINGKLSDRSFPRYRRFRRPLRPALDALDGICVQTQQDADRFAELGVAAGRIAVTGNCKFDLPQLPLDAEARVQLAAELGLPRNRRWIVAGSTHPGEETLILKAFAEVRRHFPETGLVLCPRHPERFDEAAQLAVSAGWNVGRSSSPADSSNQSADVIVLDRMGVLARAYGLGEIAIVGGSFAPIGGHNLLEAAAHRIPVVFGPHLHAQREILRLMRRQNAGTQIEQDRLPPVLVEFLKNDAMRNAEGAKAFEVVQRNRGSAARAVDAIAHWLAPQPR